MSFAQFAREQPGAELLRKSFERGRLSHGYLLSGPSVENLERLARAFIKVLNCQAATPKSDGQSAAAGRERAEAGRAVGIAESCDVCRACVHIEAGFHPDVQWIRPESKSRVITIDQTRELMQTIALKPTEARYKAAVIVGADRMNAQAANAFLKTLEEPPPFSIFMLLSTEPQQVLETVASRCLRVHLPGEPLANATAEQKAWLAEFAAKAAEAGGSIEWRYRVLGSLLEALSRGRADLEKRMASESPLAQFEEADSRVKARWEDELAAATEAEYRRYRRDLLALVQCWLRDVWARAIPVRAELLMLPDLARLTDQTAARIGGQKALKNLEVLESTQRRLSGNVQEALTLEVGLLELEL